MARAWVGISGWRYAGWRGDFYPPGLRQRCELGYAAARMDSVEINGSFYSLQRPSSYQRWYDETAPDFLFAVKGGRFITHMKRLGDVGSPLANFFASGVLALGHKLGPVLWQLPPSLAFDAARLDTFLAMLPRSTTQAAALAAGHDDRLTDERTYLTARTDQPIRHALEVRHPSLVVPDAVALLRAHDVALVVADTAGRWPAVEEVTSDFMYVRLHGADELYVSGYPPEALDRWAERVQRWTAADLDTYVYFDNDVKVHAPYDAQALRRRLTPEETASGQPA